MQKIFSVLVWSGISLLVIFWLPLLFVTRIFDRDEVRYKTGKLFRKLGLAISRINPNWIITIEGAEKINDRNPYIVVCNHLSNADIPLISNLPWEMKWVAKNELFEVPVVGWMMRMAGDISVDRKAGNQQKKVFDDCSFYLNRNCSVIFFPEGTRSRDGRLGKFKTGAFVLSRRLNVPVLPLVIDGTQDCLPKKNWVFKPQVYINLKVLDPVYPEDYSENSSNEMLSDVREMILNQLSEWRNTEPEVIDVTRVQRLAGGAS